MNLAHLTERDVLGHLLLVGVTIYLAIYVPLRDRRLKQRGVYFKNKGIMQGLYYRLQTGVDLFICKDWLPERITDVAKELTIRSSKVRCIINFEAFRAICGEEFDPTSLHAESIGKDTSVYPMYRDSGILWEKP
ncbi:hypothetical protein ACFSUS_13070 [Spirosoma soli]|uniref:Uncharacterized protein n=1 Tax=Spirosoma soli TaxID=1770529 RepID=A0ABW5M4G2_9BACT